MENQELIECAKKLKEHCKSVKVGSKCIFAKGCSCNRRCMLQDRSPEQWEIPSRIKLTEHEKVILSNIDKKYKWIARDKNGRVYVYKDKPVKDCNGTTWSVEPYDDDCSSLWCFHDLFKWLSREDKEPVYIPDLLEGE